MTESKRRGNAGRQAWAVWMLAVGLWIGMSIPALAATRPTVKLSYQPGSAPGAPGYIVANVEPADATGTVQFEYDHVAIGSPVTLVAGRAQSPPVEIPDRASYTITGNYSGDDRYLPAGTSLFIDWRPDSTEEEAAAAGVTAAPAPGPTTVGSPPSPASSKPRRLPRTGSETIPLALLASVLIGTGFVLLRKGTADTSQS